MKLTPAQLQQLRVLEAGRGAVNLGTVRALVRRGLVRERYGNELQQGVRMASAYPLTPAGKRALRDQHASTTCGHTRRRRGVASPP